MATPVQTAGARSVGPTEEQIERMVSLFYGQVREDPLLGPVFEARIGSDWDAHLHRMMDFWSSVLLATGRYRGSPLPAHDAIAELTPAHFDRWLELFEVVLPQVFSPPMAVGILARARRMRAVLDRPRGVA